MAAPHLLRRLSLLPALIGALVLLAGHGPSSGPAQAATTSADACGTLVPKATGGTWSCAFVDQFNGAALDTSKWVVQDTSRTGFYMGDTCFRNDGRQIRVRRGNLDLSVSRSSVPFTCQTPTGSFQTQFSGADLSTWGRFSQTYGRFEARIKLPSTTKPGLQGGFWLNPQKQTYGGWPNSGEIDVAEWWSHWPDHAYPSLHYPGRTGADTGWDCPIGRPDVFHTYAVEWSPTQMRFLYDGNTCFTRAWEPDAPLSAPQPFDHAFYNSLTFAHNGLVDPDLSYPQTMSVDYVKVWR